MPKYTTRATAILILTLLLVATVLYENRTGDAEDSMTVATKDNSAATTNEPIIVAQKSVSITEYGWNEGPAYVPATADFYKEPVTKSIHPSYIDDIVLHESLSENVGIRKTVPGSLRGVRMGTVRSDTTKLSPFDAPREYHTNSAEIFWLNEDDEFTAYVRFSAYGMNETLLFTALVDYEQVEFELDGVNALLHEIRTPAGTEFIMPVNLGTLSPGKHDIEIVFFANPYDGYDLTIDEPSEYFPTGDYRGVWASNQSWTAIVGDNDQPARQLLAQYSGTTSPSFDNFYGYTTVFAKPGDTHPVDSYFPMIVDIAETGDKYQFRTLAARSSPYPDSKQVIMTFVNYHLVPVNGNNLLVVDLEVGHEVIVDTSVDIPDAPGIHQIFSYSVSGPYRVTPNDSELIRYSGTGQSTIAIEAS